MLGFDNTFAAALRSDDVASRVRQDMGPQRYIIDSTRARKEGVGLRPALPTDAIVDVESEHLARAKC